MSFKPGDSVFHIHEPEDVGLVASTPYEKWGVTVIEVQWDGDDNLHTHTVETLRLALEPNALFKEIL